MSLWFYSMFSLVSVLLTISIFYVITMCAQKVRPNWFSDKPTVDRVIFAQNTLFCIEYRHKYCYHKLWFTWIFSHECPPLPSPYSLKLFFTKLLQNIQKKNISDRVVLLQLWQKMRHLIDWLYWMWISVYVFTVCVCVQYGRASKTQRDNVTKKKKKTE